MTERRFKLTPVDIEHNESLNVAENRSLKANGLASLMTDNAEKPCISGKEATYVALEAEKYGPGQIAGRFTAELQ